MNQFKIFTVICCVLTFAQVSFAQDKIGVVDIQTIVNNSSEVKALKSEHNMQIQSLNKIVMEAQNAIAKESDPQKIVTLQDKYANEFNKKKEFIDNQYSSRLSVIESKLKNEILESAKKNNYDIILAKNVVFYGGEDITNIVSRDIK